MAPWHSFKSGATYSKADVVRKLNAYVDSPTSTVSKDDKRPKVREIERLPSDWLVFEPKGKGWGSSPLNPNSWRSVSIQDPFPHASDPKTERSIEDGDARGDLREFWLPEEILDDRLYYEGDRRTIVVNAYERNNAARERCIREKGSRCSACGFDFGAVYGALGRGFIHVHHHTELSKLDGKYQIDPVRDLSPVCPNCHAMLHRRDPPLSIDDLKGLLERGCVGETAE